MNNEERNRVIAAKLDAGMSLSAVQRFLADEHAVNLTYLELRLIAADLEVDWGKQEKPRKAVLAPAPAVDDLGVDPDDDDDLAGGMRTKVTLSKVVRPGAQMSGDVEFASGAKAEWFLDAYGRLALNPAAGSTKPTEDDIQEFQVALQRKLMGEG